MRRTEAVAIGKHSGGLEIEFSANHSVRTSALNAHPSHLIMSAQAEALRSSLHELEGLLNEYTPVISGSTENVMDRTINYGAVVAEVSCPTST